MNPVDLDFTIYALDLNLWCLERIEPSITCIYRPYMHHVWWPYECSRSLLILILILILIIFLLIFILLIFLLIFILIIFLLIFMFMLIMRIVLESTTIDKWYDFTIMVWCEIFGGSFVILRHIRSHLTRLSYKRSWIWCCGCRVQQLRPMEGSRPSDAGSASI